jgi:hypothetical protein
MLQPLIQQKGSKNAERIEQHAYSIQDLLFPQKKHGKKLKRTGTEKWQLQSSC